jgi:uncharacterized membrane protein YbhN (UPF0104 family)
MFMIPKTTREWARGLIATGINGFASGVVLVIAAPETFNLSQGRSKLITTASVLAIVNLANYLKSNPLPPESSTTVTVTQTGTNPPPMNPPSVVVTSNAADHATVKEPTNVA